MSQPNGELNFTVEAHAATPEQDPDGPVVTGVEPVVVVGGVLGGILVVVDD